MGSAKGLGGRLRAARVAAKLTQAEAAKFLGDMRIMTLSAYENDQSVPRVDWVEMAAKLYRADLLWLITGAGEGPAEAA